MYTVGSKLAREIWRDPVSNKTKWKKKSRNPSAFRMSPVQETGWVKKPATISGSAWAACARQARHGILKGGGGGNGEMSPMHTMLAESMRVEFGAQNLYKKSTVVVRFVNPTIRELETGAPLGSSEPVCLA